MSHQNRGRATPTAIKQFMEELIIDYGDWIIIFLGRASHRVDRYIIQEINLYPGRPKSPTDLNHKKIIKLY